MFLILSLVRYVPSKCMLFIKHIILGLQVTHQKVCFISTLDEGTKMSHLDKNHTLFKV